MPRQIRFVIIGAGTMGSYHAQAILDDGRGRVVAVCDADQKAARRLARSLGITKVYASVEKLCQQTRSFDAGVVCTPNVTHGPICLSLLDRGKHVYCEKPPAIDAATALTILEADQRSRGLFMVGLNQRFDPWVSHVKKRLEAGEAGQIYHARAQWHRRYWTASMGHWFTNKKLSGGGPLIDIGVHRLDQTLWLLGYPEVRSVSSCTYDHQLKRESKRSRKTCDVEDFAVALIRLAGNISLHLEASYVSYLPHGETELSTLIMGTRCGFLNAGTTLRVMRNEPSGPVDTIVSEFDGPRKLPMIHFIECIIKGKKPMCTSDHGYVLMQILDAIYESSRTGREVVLSG